MQEICILLFSVEISVSLYTLLQVASNPTLWKPITYNLTNKITHFQLRIPHRLHDPSTLFRPNPHTPTLEIFTKKIFRVALARFGSVRLCTPVPLCGLWLIVKRLRLCYVRSHPKTDGENTNICEKIEFLRFFNNQCGIFAIF